MLASLSSYEISEWMAFMTLEAEDERRRGLAHDAAAGAQQQAVKARRRR